MTRYEDRSKEELLKLAADKDIAGRSAMSKDELIAALRGDSSTGADSGPDPNNPDDPTNQPYDPEGETPEGLPVGEAPAIARTGSGPFAVPPDGPPVTGPNAEPIEQRED